MGTAFIQAGHKVLISGKESLILRLVTKDVWQLEEASTRRIQEFTDTQLRQKYVAGELTFMTDRHGVAANDSFGNFRKVDDVEWEVTKLRRSYALEVGVLPSTSPAFRSTIDELWVKLGQPLFPPHISTVVRWRKKLRICGGDITGLVAKAPRKGNRKRRYDDEVLQIVRKAIDTVYLTRERKTIQDTLDKAILMVDMENRLRPPVLHLARPTLRLIRCEIETIPAFDRCVTRHGREAAIRIFRSVLAHRTTDAPLQRAEIDHTRLDIFVVDDETGLPLGRPWLTVCMDDYSRAVMGTNIGFEPPSYLTVARCLKAAFLPKTNLRTDYPSIVNDWDAHGVMRELVMDNGPEFHSKSLELACYSLGIELHYSPRKQAWFKGKIERFQGSLNRGVSHGNPGTTFSNIFEKDDYDPSSHAVVRLSVLREMVHVWIVDYYHQKPHRTLMHPPAVVWKSAIKAEDIPLPEDPARLDAILGRAEERRLTHKGVELGGLFYNSPDMTALRMELGDKLDVGVRVDDMDIGHIIVLSLDGKRMFKVPALKFGYANGLTAWQHRVCKRYAAEQLKKYDPMSWLEAKEKIAQLVTGELMFQKQRTRSKLARYKEGENVKKTKTFKDEAAPSKSSFHAVNDDSANEPAEAPSLLSSHLQKTSSDQGKLPAIPRKKFTPIVRDRGVPANDINDQNQEAA